MSRYLRNIREDIESSDDDYEEMVFAAVEKFIMEDRPRRRGSVKGTYTCVRSHNRCIIYIISLFKYIFFIHIVSNFYFILLKVAKLSHVI